MEDIGIVLKEDKDRLKFIEEALERYNFSLSRAQIKTQLEFLKLLYVENTKYNLTSITKFEDMVYKHIIDSLLVLKVLNLKEEDSFLDVGAGAGFPSIPILIVKQLKRVVQLDSSRKRVEFLKKANNKLGLEIEVLNERAEDAAKKTKYRSQFKVVTARAVAKLNILSELCIPFVEIGGFFVALKGPEYMKELEKSKNSIDLLGGRIEKIENFKIENNVRNIILIKKISQTSTKYPRSFSKISKTPL